MSKQNSIDLKTYAFWIMIIFVVCLGIYLIIYIKSESYKCMNNPLVYGVSKFNSPPEYPVTCSCSIAGSSSYLFVTKDNSTIINLNIKDEVNSTISSLYSFNTS